MTIMPQIISCKFSIVIACEQLLLVKKPDSCKIFPESGMNRITPKRVTLFVGVMTIIAIVISAPHIENEERRAAEAVQQQRAMQIQAASQKAAQDAAMEQARAAQEEAAKQAKAAREEAAKQAKAARDAEMARARAAQEAALNHAQFLARYLNAGLPPKQDLRTVAIVAASEDKVMNRAVTESLIRHFRNGNVEIYSSFFNRSLSLIVCLMASSMALAITLTNWNLRNLWTDFCSRVRRSATRRIPHWETSSPPR